MGQHVVVVGAGVVGLSVAYYAARAGHRVTVLERDAPERFTTSFGNAGLLTPSHVVPLAAPGAVRMGLRWMLSPESPFYVRPRPDRDLAAWGWRFARSATRAHVDRAAPLIRDLNLASRTAFAALAADADDFGLRLAGGLMLCRTAAGLHEEAETAALARRLGLAPEVLDPDALRRLEPDVRLDVAGGVYYPEDGFLDPGRFMASLARRAADAGAEIHWRTPLAGWQADAPRAGAPGRIGAARTERGDVEGDVFVVAGGAWTAAAVRGLGLRLPLQAGKGYHLALDAPPPTVRPRHSFILVEGRVAVTPMGDGIRFAGTMEIAAPDDDRLSTARLRGIRNTVPRYLPDLPAAALEGARPWVGHRPVSPDGLPYVGPFRRYPNLVAATGHAMMGLSLGPVTGQMVTAHLDGTAPPVPLDAFSPDRFG